MSAINRQSRVVFVHVPKTAGSSMEAVDWVGDAGHRTAAQLRARMRLEDWRSYFKFAFVREPVDRFISAYYHYVRRHPKPDEPAIYARVHRIVQAHHTDGSDVDCFIQSFDLDWLITHVNHFRPQSCFVEPGIELDFIGRFERLEDDWREVCRRVGKPLVELGRRNASVRDDTILSAEAIDRVRQLYHEDYVRWYA